MKRTPGERQKGLVGTASRRECVFILKGIIATPLQANLGKKSWQFLRCAMFLRELVAPTIQGSSTISLVLHGGDGIEIERHWLARCKA